MTIRKEYLLFEQLVKKLYRTHDSYEYTTGNFVLFPIRISDIMRLTNVYIFSDVCENFRISILETCNKKTGTTIRLKDLDGGLK